MFYISPCKIQQNKYSNFVLVFILKGAGTGIGTIDSFKKYRKIPFTKRTFRFECKHEKTYLKKNFYGFNLMLRTHLWHLGKSKFNLRSLTASTLLQRLFLLSVSFIFPMSRRYSTNWDPARKFKCTTDARG